MNFLNNFSFINNITNEEINIINSLFTLFKSKYLNIFLTFVCVLIGLIGNILTIKVFSNRKFRTNSGHVYLLCLAINDSLFLFIHLFENTLQSFNELFLEEYFYLFNLADQSSIVCDLFNYARYCLRFNSAYIILAITIQRVYIVYKPLSLRFRSKKSAWLTVLFIVSGSFLVNSWVPFLFDLKNEKDEYFNDSFCEINNDLKRDYFKINITYIALIMIQPMVFIVVSNSFIIYKLVKEESNRRILQKIQSYQSKKTTHSVRKTSSKPYYLNLTQVIDRKSRKNSIKSVRRVSALLVTISLLYVVLNLPYLIIWINYFYQVNFNHIDTVSENNLFSLLLISELFYLANYGIKFYIYCITGSKFYYQLRYSG